MSTQLHYATNFKYLATSTSLTSLSAAVKCLYNKMINSAFFAGFNFSLFFFIPISTPDITCRKISFSRTGSLVS